MDADTEQYILLVLADGNLPTGSFVASSGLESYVKHGFFANDLPTSRGESERTFDFIRKSVDSYSHTSIPFVMDSHAIVTQLVAQEPMHRNMDTYLNQIRELDAFYEVMTLNHITRRASKAQGVALLTLFSKGFSPPVFMLSNPSLSTKSAPVHTFLSDLKLEVRRGRTHGHLPVCWGALTAALGLSVERSKYLHLFLHARSLLSAAVRLNLLGPYAAQQLLLYGVRPLVDAQIARCKNYNPGLFLKGAGVTRTESEPQVQITVDGPANTWPLGEILSARHDLQHSRIFNS